MSAIVHALQVASGLMWLTVALYLVPRIVASWRADASQATLYLARNGFLAMLMFGFCARWMVWPQAVATMGNAELICWAALYAFSGLCALWFFVGAWHLRGR